MQQQGFMAAFVHLYRYKEFTQDYTLLNTLRHGLLLYYRPFLQQQICTMFVLIILLVSFTFVGIQNKKNNFL